MKMNEPPQKKRRVQRKPTIFIERPLPKPASLPEGGLLSDVEKEAPPPPLEEREEESQQAPVTAASAPTVCMDTCCQETESLIPVQPVIYKKETGRTYGNYDRYCKPDWYATRDWLVMCSTRKRLICHVCRFAASRNLLKFRKRSEDCFVTTGVNNWKKCPLILDNHEKSLNHRMAVKKWRSYRQPLTKEALLSDVEEETKCSEDSFSTTGVNNSKKCPQILDKHEKGLKHKKLRSHRRPLPEAPLSDAEEEAPSTPLVCMDTFCQDEEGLLSDVEKEAPPPPLEEREEESQQAPVSPASAPTVCMDTCCQETESLVPVQPVISKKETGRTYGNMERYCNPDWYVTRDWLVLCSTRKRLICHVCRFAASRNLVTFLECSEACFFTTGVNNWKKCPMILDKHEKSLKHRMAVKKWRSYRPPLPEEAPLSDTEDWEEGAPPPLVCMDTCCQETEALSPAQPFIIKKDTARSFGTKDQRYCNPDWYTSRDWLVLCSTRKRLLCHVCRFAASRNLIKFSKLKSEENFLTLGVNNWRKCPKILDNHEKSMKHQEAVQKRLSYKLQTSIKPVDLSAEEQSHRREGILQQLHCLRFLVRQGITIRGHDDKESNFHQLTTLVSRKNEVLESFMATGKYFSHDILNELLQHMYRVSFNALLTTIRGARHYAIVVEETRDVSGKEQLSFSLRWVSGDYTVHEDFIGMHECPNADAHSIMHTIEDVLCRCGLDMMDMRGQTYDGASVLQGQMSAVANQIKDINPKALSIHCMSHSLNLILQEVASKCPMVRGALSLIHAIQMMIASSPKSLDIFAKMRLSFNTMKTDVHVGSLKAICPARWTCRIKAVKSLLNNYEGVYYALEEMINAGVMTEAAKYAPGVKALMTQFEVHLGLKVFLNLFSSADKVARVLQAKDTSSETVQSNVNMLSSLFRGMRSKAFFHEIYESAKTALTQAPTPPPIQRPSCRFEDPEVLYRSRFFEVIDQLTSELASRFDQPTLQLLSHMENLLLAAVNRSDEGPVGIPYDVIAQCMEDVDMAMLSTQLTMLPSLLTDHNRTSEPSTSVTTIASLASVLAAAGDAANSRFSEVDKLLRLYLIVPMTNATAERSSSSLRQLQNCSPMSEKRLNHLLFLHIHKKLTDELDMNEVLKSFCFGNDRRIQYFGQ